MSGSTVLGRYRRTTAEIDALDDAIIAWVAANAPATGRGTFYGVSTAGLVPKDENGYRAVLRRLLALRRNGRVSYDDITDGTRWVTKPRTFDGWQDAVEDAARSYRRSLWSRSQVLVSVFAEKDAISGVLLPITDRWDVPLGVMRGYASESFAYGVADTLSARHHHVVVQLGDHDPSGVGAWEDFATKVRAFRPSLSAEFIRLAVTPEQIDVFDLPTRPTKQSDTRAKNWVGDSVEVDAIPAPTLRRLLDEFIAQYVDPHELAVLRTVEQDERNLIGGLIGRAS